MILGWIIFSIIFLLENTILIELLIPPCPYIYLSNTWEKYLQEFLGSKTRKRLKYELTRIERNTEIRETKIQSDNLHQSD